jgi:hypothetical protein
MLDVVLFFSGMVTLWLYGAREYSREEIWKLIFELDLEIDTTEKIVPKIILKNEKDFISILDKLKTQEEKLNHLEKEFSSCQFSFDFKKHANVLKHLKKIKNNLKETRILIPRRVP